MLLLAASNSVSELAMLAVGLLVELDALGSVLEASTEWRQDAVVIRARMLRILSLVASRYLSAGAMSETFFCLCVLYLLVNRRK